MAQPYKTCPQCGQPAVLEMPQCRRCGSVYAPTMPPQAAYPTMPGYPPVAPGPNAYPPTPIPERRRGSNSMAAMCLTVAVILLFLVVARALIRPHGAMRRRHPGGMFMTTQPAQLPHGSDLTNQPGQSGGNGGGMFQETESTQEMPTIKVVNVESDNMTLVLTDSQGRDYKVICSGGVPQTLQVPPGDYRVQVYSDNPLIQPNQGDAIFRKHKNYSAEFCHDTTADPIHLGD